MRNSSCRPARLTVRAAFLCLLEAGVFLVLTAAAPQTGSSADAKPEPGLALTITAGGQSEVRTVPGPGLYVVQGQPAAPLVPAGAFTALWEGTLAAELRGQFLFQAELNGALKLEINGQTVLDATNAGSATPMSKAIQLNKGPNSFRARFHSPAQGDAWVRLGWTEKGTNTSPIPVALLSHSVSDTQKKSEQTRLGRELFLEQRCIHCHQDEALRKTGVPELAMDAPALDGIGSRRHYEWMARWIADPKSVRPAARMPKLVHGPAAKDDAEAMAAYLASLKEAAVPKTTPAVYQTRQVAPKTEDEPVATAEPKPIYERLHCAACHNPPEATQLDPAKLSQRGVGTKFPKGRLAEFLLAPDANYAWTRMPNFHLTPKEAEELEDYLLKNSDAPKDVAPPTDPARLEQGRKLVQSSGCLNCHALKLENTFKAPALEALRSRHLADRTKVPAGDCLGATPVADYGFSAEQKAALNQFTLGGFASLSRHVPAEFAQRQTRQLNCTACHGQIELVPPLDLLGGKLKPEWSAKFMAGEVPHKIRYDNHPKGEVWVEARMPGFKARAAALAAGMSAEHGFPPRTAEEGPIDPKLAEIGRKLVGKDGGFSCVSCHGVGSMLALEVFESEGVNLSQSAERLLPGFYRRWFRNPLSVDPQTKMPVYFDEEGKSPLTDVLDGNGDAQMDAIWHYLRLRDKMTPPRTGLE